MKLHKRKLFILKKAINTSHIFGYFVPLLLIFLAFGIHLQFKSDIGGKVFLFFYPCLFIGALFGGVWPGLVSTLLASIFVWFFIIPSGESFVQYANSDFFGLIVFSFTGVLFSIFSGRLHKLRKLFKIARDDAMAIIESNSTPFLVINSDLKVRLANKSFYKKFHALAEETLDRSVFDLGSGQWKIPNLIKMLNEIFKKGIPLNGFEVETNFPVIGNRHMILNALKVNLSGSGIDTAILTIEDVTERKKMEQALVASEERYRNLVASAYDGIMVIQRDGTIEYANRQIEKMFGYEPGKLFHKSYDILIDEKDREKHMGLHQHYLIDPLSREMGKGLNLFGKRKDGTVFPVDISLSPFKADSDVLVNCMVRDITLQKNYEENRKRLLAQEKALLDEAVRSNRIKDEFLSTLSHELRTPLTTILGWAQELQCKNKLDKNVKEGLSVIERSAQVQGQLINDLLDVSRIQSGKLPLNICIIDLNEVLRLAVDSAYLIAKKKSIQIKFEMPKVPHKVSADLCRLQQVFWNLLSNAIKFTPTGGTISIELNVIERPKRRKIVRVQVKDTGMGIKPDFLQHIFERFSQADSSMARVYGGLGLGLAIVKSLVEMQNGTVGVASEGEGKGASFTVNLPLVLKKKKNLTELEFVEERQKILHRLDGLKVLVVDDSSDNLLLFSIMLKSLGAEVSLADSVKEGLQALVDFNPDVLLSDISMPEEDGYSFIRKVRALSSDRHRNIPAIALTAYAGAEDITNMLNAGFSAHLAKPVEKTALSYAITNAAKANFDFNQTQIGLGKIKVSQNLDL